MEPIIFKPWLKFKPPLKFFKFGHWKFHLQIEKVKGLSRFDYRGLTVSVSVTTTRMSSTIFPAVQTSSEASHPSSILLTTSSSSPSAQSTILSSLPSAQSTILSSLRSSKSLSNQLLRRKRRKSKHHLVTERLNQKKRRKSKISSDIIILSEDDEVTVIKKADSRNNVETTTCTQENTSTNTSVYTILEVPNVEENQILDVEEDNNSEIYKQRLE